jgi:hypothetical protein
LGLFADYVQSLGAAVESALDYGPVRMTASL